MTEPNSPPPPVPGRTLGRVMAAVFLVAYVLLVFSDYHPGERARDNLPPSVRNSPGGYRSFSFWHSGMRGGK